MENFILNRAEAELLCLDFYPTANFQALDWQGEIPLAGYAGHLAMIKKDDHYVIFMRDGWGDSQIAREWHEEIKNQISDVQKALATTSSSSEKENPFIEDLKKQFLSELGDAIVTIWDRYVHEFRKMQPSELKFVVEKMFNPMTEEHVYQLFLECHKQELKHVSK